jgi:hypothetical protein
VREKELRRVLGYSWPDMTSEDAYYDSGDVFLLTSLGMAYYLPAFLIACLEDLQSNLTFLLPGALHGDLPEILERGLLSREQAALTAEVMEILQEHEDMDSVRSELREILRMLASATH